MSWISEKDLDIGPIIRSMSINEEAMKAVQQMNRAITFGASSLTRVQEESIATTVAAINECRY